MAENKDSPQEVAATFLSKLEASPFIMIGLMDGQHSEPMNVKTDPRSAQHAVRLLRPRQPHRQGGEAMAQFVAKGHDFFACLMGESARRPTARPRQALGQPVEAWFPNGKADARLNRFDITSAETVGDRRVALRPREDAVRRHDQPERVLQPREGRRDRVSRRFPLSTGAGLAEARPALHIRRAPPSSRSPRRDPVTPSWSR
jgi:hypothetical protein